VAAKIEHGCQQFAFYSGAKVENILWRVKILTV